MLRWFCQQHAFFTFFSCPLSAKAKKLWRQPKLSPPYFHRRVHLFIYFCICSFNHSLIHLFIHSPIHPLIHSSVPPFIHSSFFHLSFIIHPIFSSSIHLRYFPCIIRPFFSSAIHLLSYSDLAMHPFTRSSIHPFSFIHSSIHPFHPFIHTPIHPLLN